MYNQRLTLIDKIAELRRSNVICYITGDRENIGTRIAPDIIPVFYEHLEMMDKQKPLDLIIYTKGGDVLTALRLVNLIYEYTDKFSVLVPFKALSSGTIVCLGASEIVMGKMSELSPIDPKITGIFNPKDPNNLTAKIPISVEDVSAYFTLIKEKVGITSDEALAEIVSLLIDHIHPLAIGTVYRTHFLIRSVARNLLLKHIPSEKEEQIEKIVDNLTTNSFSHDYLITRNEAKEVLNLPVIYAEQEVESILWKLFRLYEKLLNLKEPFIPEQAADNSGNFYTVAGVIESCVKTDFFEFHGNISQQRMDGNQLHFRVNITKQGWMTQGR